MCAARYMCFKAKHSSWTLSNIADHGCCQIANTLDSIRKTNRLVCSIMCIASTDVCGSLCSLRNYAGRETTNGT